VQYYTVVTTQNLPPKEKISLQLCISVAENMCKT